jgi:branched-chain amino acid transport system permease protein
MIAHLVGVLFDGLAYGMLLFIMSVGLAVTMGLMGFVNLAHGAFAMLGGYVTVQLMRQGGWPFLATLPAAFIAVAVVSVVVERLLYRRLYRASQVDQVLLTIGLMLMSVAAAAYAWGTGQQPVQLPEFLRSRLVVGGVDLIGYRIFLLLAGVAITAALVLGLERTRFGAQVRAAVDNQRVAGGLGINVGRVFAVTFAIGSGLAGLGGALAIDITGLDPTFPVKNLIYFLLVVSVGGLGSIGGTLAAALVLGICDVAGKYYVPQLGAFIIYAVMIALLLWRPAGLFGRRSA